MSGGKQDGAPGRGRKGRRRNKRHRMIFNIRCLPGLFLTINQGPPIFMAALPMVVRLNV